MFEQQGEQGWFGTKWPLWVIVIFLFVAETPLRIVGDFILRTVGTNSLVKFSRICFAVSILAVFTRMGIAQSSIITTYAGPALPVSGALATTQAIDYPGSVVADGAGGFYVSSVKQNRIYHVAADGTLVIEPESGTFGFTGDQLPTQPSSPVGLAMDGSGNLFIADSGYNRVRKITPDGMITTVAGNGTSGFSGDGGPAVAAQLANPYGVAIDGSGNLFIADSGNKRVRKVTPDGLISTVAGGGNAVIGDGGPATLAQFRNPTGVTVDGLGNVFIADLGSKRVRRVTPAGVITTVAGNGNSGVAADGFSATLAVLNDPISVAVDGSGNLFIADIGNNYVLKVNPAGVITTVAGDGFTFGFSGDGGPAAHYAQLYWPSGVAVDGAGNVFIADQKNNRIRKVSSAGVITTVGGNGTSGFSGDGGPATSAQLQLPEGVAVDGVGNVFIADGGNNRVRKVTPDGLITTVAGNGTSGFSGDGGPATSAQLALPEGVAADGAGNVFIADLGNKRVRKVTPDGLITTVAGNGTSGFSGDGGPAVSAQLYPLTVAVDGSGNLFIGDNDNNRVRKVTSDGLISTVAGGGNAFIGDGGPATSASLNRPNGLAVDGSGNLFISDSVNNRVRKVTPDGLITTVAGNGRFGFSGDGGPAISAQLANPYGVAIDGLGNLFIGDGGNNRVRKVTPDGLVITVAGNGMPGFSGDGGPAISARFHNPQSLATDRSGNLFIADFLNSRIRRVTLYQPPAFPRIGSFAQIAAGGGWNTTMTLTNLSTAVVSAHVNFYADDGSQLTLPVSFPGSNLPNTMSSFIDLTIDINQTAVIATTSSSSLNAGWADVSASGSLEGYAVFSLSPTGGPVSEGTVPLDSRLSSALVLPYDNTNGSRTGIAIANQSSTQANLTAVLSDQSGTQIASSQIVLPALGHTSFFVTDQFSQAANRIGVIKFQNPSGNVTGVGLVFYPGGSFTSLPIIH